MLRSSELLPLPSKKTVHNYLSNINVECGFDPNFFVSFKNIGKTLPEIARHGILLFDEIITRKSITVNSKEFNFRGLSNTANDGSIGDMDSVADHALVFMFSSLGANFHQPVAIFASKNATNGIDLAKLIVQAIILIEKARFYIHAIVCDGASNNKKMWQEFGIDGSMDKISYKFENPADEDKIVYAISDVPHIFKNIRNRLHDKKVLKVGIYKLCYTFKNLDFI